MAKKVRNYNRRYPNEYNIFRTLFYMTFLHVVVIPFMKIFYNYTITGRENLPSRHKSGKYIYTANHVSIFDPPMVTMATYRPIAYMAKKELFQDGEKLSWLVKRLGAFAVDRTKPEIATFKTVRDILATSWSLGVFPQGGTRPYGKLENIKKGFVVGVVVPGLIEGLVIKGQMVTVNKTNFRFHVRLLSLCQSKAGHLHYGTANHSPRI